MFFCPIQGSICSRCLINMLKEYVSEAEDEQWDLGGVVG